MPQTEATVFVETSSPCEVEILGRSEPTFRVEGHHYALVRLKGLEPGSSQAYEVALDSRIVWPAPSLNLPPSVIRTLEHLALLVGRDAAAFVVASPRGRLYRQLLDKRGAAPASIVVLSGDVHHAYLCDVAFRGSRDWSPVYQAVCSPYRNPLDSREQAIVRAAGFGRPLAASVDLCG